jgi:hypothetical protein
MLEEENQEQIKRLSNYKFGFEVSKGNRTEMSLLEVVSNLRSEKLKAIIDESESNSARFIWKLTEAIKEESFFYIRHDPGREMDDQMNDEVFEGMKRIYEKSLPAIY